MVDERLASVLEDVWGRLEKSAGHPDAPCGLASLATVNTSGQPSVRTVVLREVDASLHEVRCYTDRRSPKVYQIQTQPRVNWLFYDSIDRLQITLTTTARIITAGAEVLAAWEKCRPESRRNFQSVLPPGTPLRSAPPELLEESSFLQDSHEFAIVSANVLEIDWLKLRPTGNHRAHFTRDQNTWRGEWRTP